MRCRLESHGFLEWATLRPFLECATCLWAGIDGVQNGQAPDRIPAFSHLWGWWKGGRWARVRLDGDGGILAILTELAAIDPRHDADVYDVECLAVRAWSSRLYPHVGPLPDHLNGIEMTILRTIEPIPLHFVYPEVRSSPSSAQ